MSQRALCLAVRDKVRTALGVGADGCRFMPDGKPPAFAGKLWVSVHYGSVRVLYIEGFAEEFAVQVTVTMRTSDVPADQQGEEVWARETEGLDATVRQITVAVMNNRNTSATDKSVLNRANVYIGDAENGFAERFLTADEGRPEERGADWFSARSVGGGRAVATAGLSQTITFSGAKRFQRFNGPAR